jgi:hypothetical protein
MGPEPSNDPFYGGYDHQNAYCPTVDDPVDNFVTYEMWNYIGTVGQWIETGIAYGNPHGANRYYYYAYLDNAGTYHEIPVYGYTPYLNTSYEAHVKYDASFPAGYEVQIGDFSWFITGLPSTTYTLQAGTETTSISADVFGAFGSLAYYVNGSGSTHDGWNNPDVGDKGFHQPLDYGYASWITVSHSAYVGRTSSC